MLSFYIGWFIVTTFYVIKRKENVKDAIGRYFISFILVSIFYFLLKYLGLI